MYSWKWYLASNSSFWDQRNAVLILGLKQTWILLRKLHVRLAFMLTVTIERLKTEYCRRSTLSGWKTGTFNSRGISYWTNILRYAWQNYFTPCGRFGRLLIASLKIINVLLIKKYTPQDWILRRGGTVYLIRVINLIRTLSVIHYDKLIRVFLREERLSIKTRLAVSQISHKV